MPPQDRIEEQLTRLTKVIAARTSGDGDHATTISHLIFFRREKQEGPTPCIIEPSVIVVAQGAKQMLVGGNVYCFDTGNFLVTSLDLPGSTRVIEASPERPCVGLAIRLDMCTLVEMVGQTGLPAYNRAAADRSAAVGTVTPRLLDSLDRLVALLDTPSDIAVLAPLILRELHYHLLKSDVSERLFKIACAGSHGYRITRAIEWMKGNFAKPLRIEELASYAQMSSSTLHHHFRQLTAMSPLQYQKWLRLTEARRLMLGDGLDAATAAFHVGYDSPSQFSREYCRQFGAPPGRDTRSLRELSGKTIQIVSK